MASIQLKCSDEIKDMIIKRADEKKLTITSYILNLIIKDLVKGD